MSSRFQNDAIFWVEVEKIKPNPYQPRRDFNEERLRDLAESIRQYGVLQPLTVTRKEQVKEDGGIKVEYELIAGERRHRASQLANLSQVPVIIRSGKEDAREKLELAIIENLQREDLNPIERAEAFDQLAQEFEFTHKQIAGKIGKSREYVSNSMRLLKLPDKIKDAIVAGKMTEGHARPIMMLRDNPEEQETLFKEVIHKGLTVREAEATARRNAQDKVRKKKNKINPETKKLEDQLSDTLGTRVKIEERDVGGKLVIDFFTQEDLQNIIKLVRGEADVEMGDMMESYLESAQEQLQGSKESAEEEKGSTESEGRSMAETLGSMIAAARAKQQQDQGQQTDDTAADTAVEPAGEPDDATRRESEEIHTGFISQEEDAVSEQEAVDEQVQADEVISAEGSFDQSEVSSSESQTSSVPEAVQAEEAADEIDEDEDFADSDMSDDETTEEPTSSPEENDPAEEEIYSVSNFSI